MKNAPLRSALIGDDIGCGDVIRQNLCGGGLRSAPCNGSVNTSASGNLNTYCVSADGFYFFHCCFFLMIMARHFAGDCAIFQCKLQTSAARQLSGLFPV